MDIDMWVASRPYFGKGDERVQDFDQFFSDSLQPDPYEGGRIEQLEYKLTNLQDLVGRLLKLCIKERVLMPDEVLQGVIWNHFATEPRLTRNPTTAGEDNASTTD